MKAPKRLQHLLAVLLFTLPCIGQTQLSGKVVKVIDGKTFVFETDRGNVSGRVQYIDVPEAQQPLSDIVHRHLERLIAGKSIRFVPNGFSPNALVGRVYLDRLDVGLQLVRDGAAWHFPAERSGQNPDEAVIYEGHQRLAQNEKRGIWSIKNLTPAWEFRAEQDRGIRTVNFSQAASPIIEESRNYDLTKANIDMWVEVGGSAFSQVNPTGQLFWGYDPEKKLRNTSTPSVAQVFAKGAKRFEAEVRVIYFQGEIKPRAASTGFVVCILVNSADRTFTDGDELILNAVGETVSAAKGQRFWRQNSYGAQEMMQYRIGRSDLAKIANAKKVSLTAGSFTGSVGRDLQVLVRELLELAG